MSLEYTASTTVGLFMGADDRHRLIVGPVGSGKSSACCIEIVRRCIEAPKWKDGVRRSRWAVIRNTYPELRDTTIKTWKYWVPAPQFGTWRESSHDFLMRFETDEGDKIEAEVWFRALDRPDDVAKLLSLELTGCYFNEAKEIPESIYNLMDTRISRYPPKKEVSRAWTGIISDTNPPDTDHFLYTRYEEDRPEGYKVWKQPGGLHKLAENLENLDRCFDPDSELFGEALDLAREEQTERLAKGEHEKTCRCYYKVIAIGKGKDWIRVYRDGEYGYVQEGKPIYDEFVDSLHVAAEPIPLLDTVTELLIGNDYGLTPAALWAQRDPEDGQIQVIREFVSPRMGAADFGREQKRICNDLRKQSSGRITAFTGWGDPAGMAGSSIDEKETPINIVEAMGVPMSPAPTNDFTRRREAVAGLLTRLTRKGRPALVISPTCKLTRKGMAGGYCFRRLQVTGEARFEEKPLKNKYSHPCEALQYLCVGEGEDYTALDGGTPRKVTIKFKVHRALGGTVRPEDRNSYDDGEDDHVSLPKVHRRLR